MIKEVSKLRQELAEYEKSDVAVNIEPFMEEEEREDRAKFWIPKNKVLTEELIDCHFRMLAKSMHPDVNGGRGGDQFIELNQARERLLKLVK